jgi:hypothetical protein
MMCRQWFVIVFLSFLPLATASGQVNGFSFEVTSVVSVTEADMPLLRHVMDLVSDSLAARGGVAEKGARWVYQVGLGRSPGSDLVALSIVAAMRLPEAIIAHGKDVEAFYLDVSDAERAAIAPEGREVRQYMSEEYMHGFVQLQHQELRVTSVDALPAAVGDILAKLFHVEMSGD